MFLNKILKLFTSDKIRFQPKQTIINIDKKIRICFAIPASPTDEFYSQVAMFRLALDRLEGNYKDADIILSLGDIKVCDLPKKWENIFRDKVKINWAEPAYYQKIGTYAQGALRWQLSYDNYDVVIFADADTIFLKPIDEVIENVLKDNAIAGVIAHYPFPYDKGEETSELWRFYSKKFIEKDIQLNYTYTLLNSNKHDENSKCPFYVNFGFVAMTSQVYRTIRDTHLNIYTKIPSLLVNPMFCGQIALALSVDKYDIPAISLPMSYNFPNDPIADRMYPEELSAISVLHYLRTDKFDRQKIFVSKNNFEKFLSLTLTGSNKVFQEFVKYLTNGKYPFE